MQKTTITGKGGYGIITVWNRIPELLVAVEANSRMAVKKYADDIRDEAKRRVPVRTGYLRSTIFSRVVEAGKEAEIGATAEYAAYVEYGTYKMTARPYMSPAVAKFQNAFFDACGKGAVKF